MVAAMNALSRDLMWVSPATVGEIARFRVMAADFRESGEMDVLLSQFEEELETKRFLNREDNGLVKGFFVSLARSQRLIRAAARGDWDARLPRRASASATGSALTTKVNTGHKTGHLPRQ